MDEKIKAALEALDPKNDNDWTAGGLPSMERMKELTGLTDLTRAEVSAVAPTFNRMNADAAPSDLSNVGGGGNAGPTDASGLAAAFNEIPVPEPEPERRMPTAGEVAEALKDPILLLEAFVIVANSDRFRRNTPIQNLARAYMIEQNGIRELQARIDKRDVERRENAIAVAQRAADKA